MDFHPFETDLAPLVLSLVQEYQSRIPKQKSCGRDEFYHIVGHRGYLAWDISECMGHLCNGYACGLLKRNEFDDLAEYWLNQTHIFKNWVDFAASLICGELYWDFRHNTKLPELNAGMNLYRRLVSILLDNDTAWGSGMWYVPPHD